MLLGTFVPATLMIVFRNLPIRWWLPAISIYAIRVGFALDTSSSLVGFYVEHGGWQWLYWQGVVIAPLMGLMVYLGTPREPVNRELVRDADWGGMLLLGTAVSMIYAGLDQGNRLDWLESGTVMALLLGGGVLFIAFVINETMVRQPWAHVNVLFSRNVGLSLVIILLYTLTSLSNSTLVPNFLGVVGLMRPEQSGVLLLTYGALPMFVLVPISIYLLRHFDARTVAVLGFSAFAAANLWGTQLTHDWARRGLCRHRAAAIDRAGIHAAANHHHGVVQRRSEPGHGLRRLYPDHAARRRRDRHRADGDLAAGPRADPLQLSWPAHRQWRHRCDARAETARRAFCRARRGLGASPRRGNARGAGAARGQRDGLSRRFLAVLLARHGRAVLRGAGYARPAGPFTPAPFGFARNVLRKCGVAVQ